MRKFLILGLISINIQSSVFSQTDSISTEKYPKQYFGIQAGFSLLDFPFLLYPMINLSYSKTVMGNKKHQLAILPQFGAIFLSGIETKFLISNSIQYKYISKKRFEANVFLGINYQLRKLAYERFQFEDNVLKNKGKYLHQLGPTMGINIGYKVIKKNHFSISPFLCYSLTKLNKNYQPNFFNGYEPTLTIGLVLNK